MAIDPIPRFGKLGPMTASTSATWGGMVITISSAFANAVTWVIDFAAGAIRIVVEAVHAAVDWAVDFKNSIRRANREAQLKLLGRFQLKLSREPVRKQAMPILRARRRGRAASLSSAWRLAAA